MKKLYFVLFFNICTMTSGAQNKQEMNRFIDNLMSKMTIEEKIGQLNLPGSGDIVTGQAKNSDVGLKIKNGGVGALFNIKGVNKIREVQRIAVEESRLGIPLIFGMDVIHGYETVFPIPLALATTWDMEAIEESARIAAVEASADGICWTFSPMVDICRDPRWGRIAEGSGEDPYLGSEIAKAMVRGYQGKDNSFASNENIMACVKHFGLYGASEAGRDYNTVDMSRQRMYNEYFGPYKAAVDAGAGSVMVSFNEIDGIPATANKWLLTEVLRKQWGFQNFVVTDYTGINEMVDHGIGDLKTVSTRALDAGVNMDMAGEGFLTTLLQSLKAGTIKEDCINDACRSILEAKYKLGLFSDPYRYCVPERAATDIYTKAHRATARKIASESFVLLKNDGNILPLKKKGKIAVIGPLADNRENMPGTWSVAVDFTKPATVIEGLRSVGDDNVEIVYAKGCNIDKDRNQEERYTLTSNVDKARNEHTEEELRAEALAISKDADVIVAAVGEASEMSGECSSRANLEIPAVQQRLLKELVETGKPVVLVLFTGRPLTLVWEEANIPAILNVWFGGTEAAYAIGDVLFGDVNPGGKLTATFPKSIGQVPLYYNHKNTGRPLKEDGWFEKFRSNYLDIDNDPLYPFGYGLSYTSFSYGDIKLSDTGIDNKSSLTAYIKVSNTGKFDGYEVVQLYIRDLVGSITRPVKELKGFSKVFIKAGESKNVEFTITPEMLKFYNYDLEYVNESGEFEIMIGGNSRDVKSNRFTLNE